MPRHLVYLQPQAFPPEATFGAGGKPWDGELDQLNAYFSKYDLTVNQLKMALACDIDLWTSLMMHLNPSFQVPPEVFKEPWVHLFPNATLLGTYHADLDKDDPLHRFLLVLALFQMVDRYSLKVLPEGPLKTWLTPLMSHTDESFWEKQFSNWLSNNEAGKLIGFLREDLISNLNRDDFSQRHSFAQSINEYIATLEKKEGKQQTNVGQKLLNALRPLEAFLADSYYFKQVLTEDKKTLTNEVMKDWKDLFDVDTKKKTRVKEVFKKNIFPGLWTWFANLPNNKMDLPMTLQIPSEDGDEKRLDEDKKRLNSVLTALTTRCDAALEHGGLTCKDDEKHTTEDGTKVLASKMTLPELGLALVANIKQTSSRPVGNIELYLRRMQRDAHVTQRHNAEVGELNQKIQTLNASNRDMTRTVRTHLTPLAQWLQTPAGTPMPERMRVARDPVTPRNLFPP